MRSRKGGTRVGAKQSATSRNRRKVPSRRRKVRIGLHLEHAPFRGNGACSCCLLPHFPSRQHERVRLSPGQKQPCRGHGGPLIPPDLKMLWRGSRPIRLGERCRPCEEEAMTYGPAQLAAYLERIGYRGTLRPDRATLKALQRAHRLAIAFENLDIPLGRGIALAPGRLFEKIVTGRRGGYCFEQNGLFLAMLGALGFAARPLLARVWLGAEAVPGRTHTLNLVRLDGAELIVDVGF